MDFLEYFKEGKHTYIFGKKITNNGVDRGNSMCNTVLTFFLNAEKLKFFDGIKTVANSKGNVSNIPTSQNGINNSLITKRDVLMTMEQLG